MRTVLVILSLIATEAFAAAEEPADCGDNDLYARLDFWLGEWDVYSDDQLIGTNRIESILAGCAVLEHWRGSSGGEGKSLFYVTDDGNWKQVWVTQWATRPGGIKEKAWQPTEDPTAVRFQGRIKLPDGGDYLDRTTLTLLPSGEVRQVIETSADGGQTWAVGFDAIYRRRQ